MPGKLRNSDSWFAGARRNAGFITIAALEQKLGFKKGKVEQWERGSEREPPSHRPPWRYMPQLADALRVPLPELVKALWREEIGELCPCGCGGKKTFPEAPGAVTLVIEIPCENAERSGSTSVSNVGVIDDFASRVPIRWSELSLPA